MIVNCKKLLPNAVLPTYGTEYSAAADLYALIDNEDKEIIIPSNGSAFLHTGISVEIPTGYVGLVFARSGMACKKGLAPANAVGVIDSDYRGELLVCLYNHGEAGQRVEDGDRIAQLMIVPYVSCEFNEVDGLGETERGAGGFGHTGEK